MAEKTLSGTTSGQFNSLNQLINYGSVSGTQTVAGTTSGSVSSVSVNGQSATVTSGTNFTANVPLPPGSTNTVSIVAKPGSGSPATQRFGVTTSGTANTALTYDTDGNTFTDENGNQYTWDALSWLISITYPSGAGSQFAYDGLSRRVQILEKDSSGSVTSTKNYLWIGSEMAEERDASNNVTKRFYAQGEQQSGANYYYTRDHLSSVRELVNGSGSMVARYSYDPYGRTTLVSGSNLATFQYTGDYAHQASGLELTQYRAYDPNTGRWLSRDPMGEPGGIDLYQYVQNDSINGVDPFGLFMGFWIPDSGHFHWYGNWGGPHWTDGSPNWAEAENFPNDKTNPKFKPPIDARDTCYYHHDVCLHNCGTIPLPDFRQACRAGCDHSLSTCLCAVKIGKPARWEINLFHGSKGDPSPNDNPGQYYPAAKPYPYLY